MLKVVLPVAQRETGAGSDADRGEARMSEPEYEVVVSAEQQQHAEELGEELPATLPACR